MVWQHNPLGNKVLMGQSQLGGLLGRVDRVQVAPFNDALEDQSDVVIAEFWLRKVAEPFGLNGLLRVHRETYIEHGLEQSGRGETTDEGGVFLLGEVFDDKEGIELGDGLDLGIDSDIIDSIQELLGLRLESVGSDGIDDEVVEQVELLVVVALAFDGFNDVLEMLHR